MKRADVLERVVTATVRLPKLGGQGVLVPGNLIVTAAHCVEFKTTAAMALGDFFIEPIETTVGTFKVAPLAVEPVSDIAVLGALDNQTFSDECNAFEEFCEKTTPVPIFTDNFRIGRKYPARIRTHKRGWLEADVVCYGGGRHRICVEAHGQVESGTSGGPIVTTKGELIGVVSHSHEMNPGDTTSTGIAARPHLSLPGRVWQQIKSAQLEQDR